MTAPSQPTFLPTTDPQSTHLNFIVVAEFIRALLAYLLTIDGGGP